MSPMDKEVKQPLRAGGGGESAKKAEYAPVPEFKTDHPTRKHLGAIYKNLALRQTSQDDRRFSNEQDFLEYMRSHSASALAPPSNDDLQHPLSSYFISSSHNTYLVGNQLYGDATTAGYTNVLKRGCRCLEIDVWDGDETDTSGSSSDEEPAAKVSSSPHKRSRWNRMKSKAKVIRGVSPRRGHHASDRHDNTANTARYGASAQGTTHEGQAVLKPEPQVVHGYTLTAAVPFRDVCIAIKESAFVATNLPLIVSLETHCNHSQQEVMVEIMKEIWGEYLVDAAKFGNKDCGRLPTPESLRGKILVKVKQAGISQEDLDIVKSNSTDASASSQHTAHKPSKMLQALSDLGLFTKGYSFKGWDQPEAAIPSHVFSLTDSKAHSMLSDPVNGVAMFKHNLSFMTRIYPKGTRISSSNYDPACHWRHGAQMVALNWQKLDMGMMLNEAMFAGYEGWVLKPDGFRGDSQQTDADALRPDKSMDLKIQLFSAENLPTPPERDASHAAKMKPYVQFELHVDTHGPPSHHKEGKQQSEADVDDEDKKQRRKHKRRSETRKTDAPDFEGESLTWSTVDVIEELSFLRLKIRDDRSLAADETIAWAAIRLDRLKTGYRLIHLVDPQGLPTDGVLLANISKTVS